MPILLRKLGKTLEKTTLPVEGTVYENMYVISNSLCLMSPVLKHAHVGISCSDLDKKAV